MGRAPCCDKASVKKGPWSPEEDRKLKEYIHKHGTGGNWIALPHKAGLKRCGKSCRLRWLNYLRPNIKHGDFSDDEDRIICSLFATIGSRWSIIAAQLPGRTDNDIKNYWNTKLKKKLIMHAHHGHDGSTKQQQQQLLLPTDQPAALLPQHLSSLHSYSHPYSYDDAWTTTSTILAAAAGGGGGLVLGNHNNGEQQMMSLDNGGSLGLYFEALCNNSSVQQGDSREVLESFVLGSLQLQEDRHHHKALLLAGGQLDRPDHQYSAAGYDDEAQTSLVNATAGGSFFYGCDSEETATTSASATAAVVSLQGRFMY
ncbi:hypothetical protein ACP70R_049152 [Stipagrostis hirtigluma subsp. patula]